MRTTLNLEDKLLRAAKKKALEENITLTKLVEDALSQRVMQSRKAKSAKKLKLHVFRGKGVQPGVDLDNTASLLEIMEPHASP